MFICSSNLITFHPPRLEDTPQWITLSKTAALIAKFYPCSRSFSSTLIWLTAAFFQAKQSSGKGIEEIYFRRKRIDRDFWRFDSSPVDLKLCNIRIMSVKWLNYLIWLKNVSRIRGKFQKCYLPNISDSKIRQRLPSSNIGNAFAKEIVQFFVARQVFLASKSTKNKALSTWLYNIYLTKAKSRTLSLFTKNTQI